MRDLLDHAADGGIIGANHDLTQLGEAQAADHGDDGEATVKRLEAAGAQVQQASRDVGGGKLVATVTDADGNLIGLVQSPW